MDRIIIICTNTSNLLTIIIGNSCFFLQMIGCVEGNVRLSGGYNYLEGRVEICMNNEWGTVCNQMWNDTNAIVVCRQLRLKSAGINEDK